MSPPAEPGAYLIELVKGRSPEIDPRNRRLHQIAELTTASHEHFVGRTWELAGLGSDFIGSSTGTEVKPVAVITGLGGMGKTALVAEALALWETRFDWVLLYQAKPYALGFDATLRDIDLKLRGELGRYHDHVKARPADAIYRDASAEFTGPDRLERLTHNLIRALQDEAILLVLDNFETNLKPQPEPSSVAAQPVWACQDSAWDECLALLAQELAGSPSRVLITSRKPLAALADGASYPVLLGPLPPSEAALYLRAHPALSRMVFGIDEKEKLLAQRLLNASRFHPLLMDRLVRLAANALLRPQLLQALDTLEQTKDFAQLPALFATTPGDTKELDYLNDALAASLDQLIRDASPDARRLLWMIAVANEPVDLNLLEEVWSGESHEQELWEMKRVLENLPLLPAEFQSQLEEIFTPKVRAMLDAVVPRPRSQPLLHYLLRVGLVTEKREGLEDNNPDLVCHELVRERIRAWMDQQPYNRGDLTEKAVWLAYANKLVMMSETLQNRSMSAAIQIGSRAAAYYVQAEAYEKLNDFTSLLITNSHHSQLLMELLPYLKIAAESAPPMSRIGWRCLGNLADALNGAGSYDVSLLLYEQAASRARAFADTGGSRSLQAWADLACITDNWANALRNVGDLDSARQRHLESAEAENKAGNPIINVIVSELEALHIDILQGQAARVLPQVEARLAQIEEWWWRDCAGHVVPEAPKSEFLVRALISALHIVYSAHASQENWESALCSVDASLKIMRALGRPAEHIARDRMNRANLLIQLRRFSEASTELEDCLQVFQNDPSRSHYVFSSLASLFYERGDIAQAITQQRRALALCETLPDLAGRAHSHHNLANYLEYSGTQPALTEALYHRLASLIYLIVTERGQDIRTALNNYGILLRRANEAGITYAVPRVMDLLAEPSFCSLDCWLRELRVDLDVLQGALDQVLESVAKSILV